MSLELISRPADWCAAKNPMVYTFKREDYYLTEGIGCIENESGFAEVLISADFGDISGDFTIGDTVYFYTANGTYSSTGTITSVLYSTSTKITTDVVHIDNGGIAGGYLNVINAQPNHRIDVEVFASDGPYSLTNGLPFSYYPDRTGYTYVDISKIVLSRLSADWSLPSSDIVTDSTCSIEVFIKYQEFYDDSATSLVSDAANAVIAVNAALQIYYADRLNQSGGDLNAYVPADSNSLFLTRFKLSSALNKMRYWAGYPFTISFIWPDGYNTLYRRLTEYDSAGGVVATTSVLLDDLIDVVSRLKLPTLNDNTTKVELFLSETEAGAAVTTTLTIDVEEVCDNPVYLFWKNSLGGDSFYMFQHGQDVGFTYSGGRKVKRKILYAENLLPVEWEALNELNSALTVYRPNVITFDSTVNKTSAIDGNQVYIIDTSGNKVGVTVIPRTGQFNTKDETRLIIIEIELPETFE